MCPPNGNTSKKYVPWPISVAAIVLVAVLVPYLQRVAWERRFMREPRHPPICSNNLRAVMVAVQVYCADFEDHLPSSALVSGSPSWNQSDFAVFATKNGKTPRGSEDRQTYKEVIYDYLKHNSVCFCPYDPVDRADPNAPASYHWKLAIDKAWYGEGCSKPYRKLDDYLYAADTILLYERQGFHDKNKPLSNGTRINVAYLDSHVKNIALKNATTGDPVNCAANADGEPMYFNYDYETDKGLPSETTPAKWTDPGRYGDKL